MHVQFTKRTGKGPIADASIRFEAGPLQGFELGGCAIWHGEKGLFATVPTREWESNTGKKRFDLLRKVDSPENGDISKWAAKNWLVDEYKKWSGAVQQADGHPGDEEVPW